jgi:1-phosphofructokinase family hexose kinase
MIYTVTLNPAVDRELTVPVIEADVVLRATDVRLDYGGKGFNVSRMLKSLGAESVAVGFVGGKSGEWLRDGLASLDIATDFVWVGGETRTNVSIVPADHSSTVKVNEAGPTITPEDGSALVRRIRELAAPDDWWVFAGSLPPGVPPGFYGELVAIVQSAGGHALLDTSGEPLRLGCAAGAEVVKPNVPEAGRLTGLALNDTPSIVEAARHIRALGVTHVIISLGPDGALLATQDGSWQVHSPRVAVSNPIGAGDSLVGGLVYGLAADLDLVEALRWGVACGAAAASLSGTAVGSRELVESLLKDVPAGTRVS